VYNVGFHTKEEIPVSIYNNPAVVSYYSALNYLTACEQLLFDKYLSPGMDILDLGVGGGRTTAYLSSIAGRYVGADSADEMIATCRRRFPALEFQVVAASDLSIFATSSFDAVVMAYNTIDCVASDESRYQALRETHRVLKPNGILIFSSHNVRSIFVRPSWNPLRLTRFAKQLAGGDSVLYRALLRSLTAARVLIAIFQSAVKSLARVIQRVPRRAFWLGAGYLIDTAHGGVRTHFSTSKKVEQELTQFSFRLLRILGDDYPRVSRAFVTDWYYYVFSRMDALVGREVCA
jgi:ubiquinone/menaquinone biosynthesis C-methylase UbiE